MSTADDTLADLREFAAEYTGHPWGDAAGRAAVELEHLRSLTAPKDPAEAADLGVLRRITEHHGSNSEEYRALRAAMRELLELRAQANITDRDRIRRALDASERNYVVHADGDMTIPGRKPARSDLCQDQPVAILEFDGDGALVDIVIAH